MEAMTTPKEADSSGSKAKMSSPRPDEAASAAKAGDITSGGEGTDEDMDQDGEGVPAAASKSDPDDATKMETVFNSKIAFPLALTHMLESVDEMGLSHIVHWSDQERSFIIEDIDAFLADVLPKFFKASENTKIRSFYRKLNRWGFSMSRKNSKNPNNVWRHPEFNRTVAVKALADALKTGKATDFLNMTIRGKRRRELEASFASQFSLGFEDDDSTIGGSSIASGIVSHTSLNLLSHSRVASMPTLPSVKLSSFSERKRWKMGLSSRTSSTQQLNQNQRTRLGNSLTVNNLNLRNAQSMQTFAQGNANATFDLIRPPAGASNANATFDLIPPNAGASNGNATFDLSLLTAGGTSGGMPGARATSNPFAPSTNIFAQSAQEMLAAHNPILMGNVERAAPFANASTNVFDRPAPFASASTNVVEPPAPFVSVSQKAASFGPGSSRRLSSESGVSFGSGMSTPQPVNMSTEMTPQEDDELMAFFGNFAKTMPPPREDDEECVGEPEPLPFKKSPFS